MPEIRPIKDLRNTTEISELCHKSKEPIFITKNGYNTRYPEEFKRQIVKEVEEVGNTTLVARKHDIVPGTVTRWIR